MAWSGQKCAYWIAMTTMALPSGLCATWKGLRERLGGSGSGHEWSRDAFFPRNFARVGDERLVVVVRAGVGVEGTAEALLSDSVEPGAFQLGRPELGSHSSGLAQHIFTAACYPEQKTIPTTDTTSLR